MAMPVVVLHYTINSIIIVVCGIDLSKKAIHMEKGSEEKLTVSTLI
jgi:hypothetical protein